MMKKISIGFISVEIPNVSPNEALVLCRSGAVIIDIRPDYITAFKKFDVNRVIYSPRNIESPSIDGLDKNQTYIVTESTASEYSKPLLVEMLQNEFKSVYNLAGGFVEWERDNLPVIVDLKERLSGACACTLRRRG